ncbi:MAG TPA: 1-(5-phosphoribosyl)-5-[(5-phosphoribosylamino)methylideneamino]imidazole-4-carboxamide isomerase [Candidatus Hydrogenedentes bacterium]|nr:1-(5-phosphoribosyl)-5-[(5-phosphoribosylamino)methylideneamino]imidazole-4-carboxamide isomerase [Candidatus Hydrogenedentota bacterium]
MRIVPAVDIRGGLCVNLVQGNYDQETVFSDDPVDQAVQWHKQGGGIVHIVDLDGAKAGRCCIEDELKAMRDAAVPVEVGGGIRNMDTISMLFDLGAERVILGTAAHADPDFLKAAADEFPDQIVVGIDAKDGKVALSGWLDVTATDAEAFALQVEAFGVSRIIYTDINSDGMMGGPNLEATFKLAKAVDIPITASGGMSTLEDIASVKKLEPLGVDEVIIGRALYLNVFSMDEALAAASSETP